MGFPRALPVMLPMPRCPIASLLTLASLTAVLQVPESQRPYLVVQLEQHDARYRQQIGGM